MTGAASGTAPGTTQRGMKASSTSQAARAAQPHNSSGTPSGAGANGTSALNLTPTARAHTSTTSEEIWHWIKNAVKWILAAVGCAAGIAAFVSVRPTQESAGDGSRSLALSRWTAAKDYYEFCETHKWVPAGCAGRRDTPPGPPPNVRVRGLQTASNSFNGAPYRSAIFIVLLGVAVAAWLLVLARRRPTLPLRCLERHFPRGLHLGTEITSRRSEKALPLLPITETLQHVPESSTGISSGLAQQDDLRARGGLKLRRRPTLEMVHESVREFLLAEPSENFRHATVAHGLTSDFDKRQLSGILTRTAWKSPVADVNSSRQLPVVFTDRYTGARRILVSWEPAYRPRVNSRPRTRVIRAFDLPPPKLPTPRTPGPPDSRAASTASRDSSTSSNSIMAWRSVFTVFRRSRKVDPSAMQTMSHLPDHRRKPEAASKHTLQREDVPFAPEKSSSLMQVMILVAAIYQVLDASDTPHASDNPFPSDGWVSGVAWLILEGLCKKIRLESFAFPHLGRLLLRQHVGFAGLREDLPVLQMELCNLSREEAMYVWNMMRYEEARNSVLLG